MRCFKSALAATLIATIIPAIAEDKPKSDLPAIALPDQTISDFKFSALQLSPAIPELKCIVTAPATYSGTLNILVMLFDPADAAVPYDQVSGSATLQRGMRAPCDINNGVSGIPKRTPKKIEIQIKGTTTFSENKPVVLP